MMRRTVLTSSGITTATDIGRVWFAVKSKLYNKKNVCMEY